MLDLDAKPYFPSDFFGLTPKATSGINDIKKLKEFFSSPLRDGTPCRPVDGLEMMEFWKSLSAKEKEYYQTVDLNG